MALDQFLPVVDEDRSGGVEPDGDGDPDGVVATAEEFLDLVGGQFLFALVGDFPGFVSRDDLDRKSVV